MSIHHSMPKEGPMFAEDLRRRERRRRFQSPLWPVASFLLHGLGLVALVMFTPLREIAIPEPKEREPMTISAERLEELAEDLQSIRLDELLAQLDALQIILQDMDGMKLSILKDYDDFAVREQATAKASLASLFQSIVERQSAALSAQGETIDAASSIARLQVRNLAETNVTLRIRDHLKAARPSFEQIDSAQAVAQNLLDKVFVEAELVGLPKTAAAARAVRDVQLKANTMQRESQRRFSDKVKSVAAYATVQEEELELKRTLRETVSDLKAVEERIVEQRAEAAVDAKAATAREPRAAEMQTRLDEAKAEAEAAKGAVESLDRELAETGGKHEAGDATPELQDAERRQTAALEQAQREVRGAEDRLRSRVQAARAANESLSRDRKRAESSAARVVRAEVRRDHLQAMIEKTRQDIAAAEHRKVEIETIAKRTAESLAQGQREAQVAQRELIRKVAAVAELARQEQAALELRAPKAMTPDPLATRAVSRLHIVEAYEVAKALETRITESYREVKSAESAILGKMSFNAAEKITDVANPVRPQFDVALLRARPRDVETFARQKGEAMEVVQEADGIVEAAAALLAAAKEIVKPEPAAGGEAVEPNRLERMYELAALNQRLSEGAAESDVEKAKDLSQIMAGALVEAGEEAQDAAETAAALSAPDLGPRIPDLVPGNVVALHPGAPGVPTRWMYVNSWHVIGPFPNPDRVNIRRRFPPETVVDLEAAYIGKGGLPVRWEFEQARSSVRNLRNRALVIPRTSQEYGIWYAYAEVFFDQDCDLWIAVGSDDRSDLWLNDMHVWGSSNVLKDWKINEGFRKVHFNQGRNRFLARVENGPLGIKWSVCIALTDDKAM